MIDVAKDFSPYPSGRVDADSDKNGTRFRNEHLIPALKRVLAPGSLDTELVVDIDGVRSFGSSFLEEAFGGVIRAGGFNGESVVKAVRIQCSKPNLVIFRDAILSYLDDALVEWRQNKA